MIIVRYKYSKTVHIRYNKRTIKTISAAIQYWNEVMLILIL